MKNRFTPELFEKPTLSRLVLATFRHYWQWASTVFILRLGTLSTEITWPLFIKLIIDDLTLARQSGHIDWDRMYLVIFIGLAAWLGTDLPNIATRLISGPTRVIVRADLRKAMLQDLYAQSQSFFHDRFAGSISTSMRDLSEAVSDIADDIVSEFIPVIILVICLGVVFLSIHPFYVMLMLAWVFIHIGINIYAQKHIQLKAKAYAGARSDLFGNIIDSLGNHMAVRSFGLSHAEKRHIEKTEIHVIKKRMAVIRFTEGIEFTTTIIAAVFFLGFLFVYFLLFQQGKVTPGDFVFLIGSIWGLMKNVNRLSQRILLLYDQTGVGQEAIAKILVPHDISDLMNANSLQVTQSTIQVKNLGFSYNAERPILHDVSFMINSGEKVGIVGYSGAGKSTLVYLLMRFYDATSGSIHIQGEDIRNVTQESLRRNVALIPQDITLFHRSVKENIRIASPDATDEQIVEACKLAGAHDFILTLQEQYETLVGERGIKLSGGQRQRIAIARAFLKAAPILILDEATSALDSVTEHSVQLALDKVMADKTTIVIAHRLSTLRQMDRILVFDQGHIIEEGSHGELMAIQGHYARMWEMQAGGFLPQRESQDLSDKA